MVIRSAVSGERPKKITMAEKVMVVNRILSITHFGPDTSAYGVDALVKEDVLQTAYPLHDGDWVWTNQGPLNDRQVNVFLYYYENFA